MNTTQKTPIDYWAIFNGLLGFFRPENVNFAACAAGMEPYEELRELRTIGFKTYRQQGKTHWALEALAKYPTAVMVVTTPAHADKAKARQYVNEDMASRILTAYEVIPDNYTEKTLALLKAAEFIIVDESIFVYGRCNRNKFLKGIVQHIPASTVLVEIN